MKKLFVLLAAVGMLAASTASMALPTIGSINETTVLNAIAGGDSISAGPLFSFTGGATGGLQVATADIQQDKFALAIDRAELEVARIPSMRALFNLTEDLEAGIGYEDIAINTGVFTTANQITISALSLNAKYALPYNLLDSKWAIGANWNQMDTDGLLPPVTATNIYVAATRALGETSKLTANVTYTMLDVANEDLEDDTDFAFGLGFEKAFENDTVAGIEAVLSAGELLHDEADAANYLNAYVNFPINEMLTGRVALVGIGEFTTTSVGVGVKF